MTISLSQLRIEAVMDASAYKAGADQKTASDAKMVQSGQAVAASLDVTERKLGTSATAVERLSRSVDPAYASQQKLSQGTVTLQRALDAGSISAERHAELLALLQQRYTSAPQTLALVSNAVNDNTKAFALNRQGAQELQAAGINAFQALASGMSPLRVATMEGAQAFGAFAQGGLGVTGVLKALISPLSIVAVGAAALAVGFAVLLERSASNESQLRQFNLALGTTGDVSSAAIRGMQAGALALRNMGVAATDANKAMADLARNPIINPAASGELQSIGADLGARLGVGPDEGLKTLSSALTAGVDATVKLGLETKTMTGDEAAAITIMKQHGDTVGALNRALGDLKTGMAGAHDQIDPTAKSAEALRTSWNSLLDSLSNSAAFKVAHEGLTTLLTDLNNLISKGQTPQSTGMGALFSALIPGYAGRLANGQLGNALSLGNPAANQSEFANAFAARGGGLVSGGGGLGGGSSAIVPNQVPGLGVIHGTSSPVLLDPGGRPIVWGNELPQARLDQNSSVFSAPQWGSAATYSSINIPSSANLGAGGPEVSAGGGTGSAIEAVVTDPIKIAEAKGALDEYNRTLNQTLQVQGTLSGPVAKSLQAQFAAENAALKQYGDASIAATAGEQARLGSLQQTNVEVQKEAALTDLATQGQIKIAGAYAVSETAGLKAAAAEQARVDVLFKGGNEATRTQQILTASAAAALEAGAKAIPQIGQQVAANENLAAAAAKGTAAEHDAAIQNQVTAATHNALAAAIASGDPALIEQAKSITAGTEALIRRNDAAQTAVQLNQQINANSNQADVFRREASFAGQTTEEINRQVALLQAKQLLQSKGVDLSSQEAQNYLGSVDSLSRANIALSEANQNASRVNDTMRSIGSEIDSAITNNLQNAFSGQAVTKWGDIAKQVMAQIQAQLISLTLIKPAIGSVLSLLGFSGAASNFGSLFSGVGSLSGNSLFGGLFGGNDNKQTLTDSSGKVIGTLSSGSNSSGGLFSGVGSFINNNIGSKLGFSAGNSLSQSDLLGLGLPAEQAAGGFSDVGGLFGATTLTSVLPFAGAALGLIPLISGLFGNSKPSNFSSGALVDLASGKSSFSSSGNAQNDQTVNSITSGVSQFIQQVQQLTGGAIGGVINPDAGSRDGIKVHYILGNGSGTITAGSADDAVAQIEQLLIKNIAGVTGTLKTLIDQISDPAQLQSIVSLASAYDNVAHAADPVIASLDQTTDAFAPYTAALAALDSQYATLTAQAQQYGLALDPITQAQTAAKSAIQGKFSDAVSQAYNSASGNDFLNSISTIEKNASSAVGDAQSLGAGQDTINQIYATREALLKSTLQGLSDDQLTLAIQQFGSLDDTVSGVVSSIRAANQALTDQATAQQAAADAANQAAAAQQAQADALAKTTAITAWLNGEALGSNSSLSPAAQLSEAQRQFSAASGGTDANALTSAADALLNAAKAFYASSPGYAAIESMTRSQVARFGNLPGFATGGSFTVGGFGGTDSQLVAFRASPAERVTIGTPANANDTAVNNALLAALLEEVQGLRASNEQMSRDFAMFRQQLKTLKPAA